MINTTSSHSNSGSKVVAISVAMVGHSCFDAPDVREAIVECLAPSPTCRENGISRTCRLWSVVWNRKMMKWRRSEFKWLIDFVDNEIETALCSQCRHSWQAEISANEIQQALSVVADIM